MPRLPKQTLTLDQGRVHLDRCYHNRDEIMQSLRLQVDSGAQFEREEQNYNALFLRTLSRMLAEGGYKTSAEQMYPVSEKLKSLQLTGSQSQLVLANLHDGVFDKETRLFTRLGKNESTTGYESLYDFLSKKPRGTRQTFVVPYHAWDYRAVKMLRDHQVPEETLHRFAEDFLKLADMSDHDYLHHLFDTRLELFALPWDEKISLTQPNNPFSRRYDDKRDKTTGDAAEDVALTLHAQVLDKLFEESPRRKEHVLAYAAEAYGLLAGMQKEALAVCETEQERDKVREAITYFAEITAHRMFRIFSPADRDFYKKTSTGRSVAEAVESLELLTPPRLLEGKPGLPPKDTLELLERHCADWLGDTYRAIHTPGTFQAVIRKKGQWWGQKQEASPLELLSLLDGLSARRTPGTEEYLAEATARAEQMNEAAELRKAGDSHQASLIEARLRANEIDAPSALGKKPSAR